MSSQLLISVNRVEGALLRVMGLIGRRGHEIERIVAQPTDDGTAWSLSLQTRGDRPIDVLVRQIGKLVDVNAVHASADQAHHVFHQEVA